MHLLLGNGEKKSITCPFCMEEITRKAAVSRNYPRCPKCNARLPKTIFQCDRYINVCLVGQVNCGKTVYMTVMVNEFSKKLTDKLHLETMIDYDDHDDDENRRAVEANIRNLYEEKRLPENTHENVCVPQIYQIKDMMRGKIGQRNPIYCLTVLDGAGEDYKKMTDIAKNNIRGADYILYLVDPTTLPAVQRKLGKKTADGRNGETIARNMAQYLREALNLHSSKKITKPIAVLLTKFDVIQSMMPGAKVARQNDLIIGKTLMKSDMDDVNAEIRSWFRANGETQFWAQLEADFSNIRFFGVSSIGHDVPNKNDVGIVTPHRVLDPILWVMSEERILVRVEV